MRTDIVDQFQQYKYLGIFHICDDIFAKSGTRALTSLISRYNIPALVLTTLKVNNLIIAPALIRQCAAILTL